MAAPSSKGCGDTLVREKSSGLNSTVALGGTGNFAATGGFGSTGGRTWKGWPSGEKESTCCRGWKILREHWKTFIDKSDTKSRRPLDLGSNPNACLKHRNALSKEAADRAMDKIISMFSEDSPRQMQHMKVWSKARKEHQELRAALVQDGWKPPVPASPSAVPIISGSDVPAAAFFPRIWHHVLSEELLADLVLDAFSGALADAFVDGAVQLAEQALEDAAFWPAELQASHRRGGAMSGASMNATATLRSSASGGGMGPSRRGSLSRTASEPLLSHQLPRPQKRSALPAISTPFEGLPPEGDLYMSKQQLGSSASVGSTGFNASTTFCGTMTNFGATVTSGGGNTTNFGAELSRTVTGKSRLGGGSPQIERSGNSGFIMAGLQEDSHEAWHTRRYHDCKPVATFQERIRASTEFQRPSRRVVRKASNDLRKYVWPMSKSHLPEVWDEMTSKKERPGRRRQQEAQEAEDSKKGPLSIGEDGKTYFPYSLSLHKAFLESQPDEALRGKARAVAPLRFSTYGDSSYK